MRLRDAATQDLVVLLVLGAIVIPVFGSFIFTDKMLFGTDMVPMGFMMRKAVADSWRQNHSLPLWDPYILCGLPVVDAMHGDLFYPPSLLYLAMPLHKALGYKIVLHVWLAGLTMFFLLKTLGLRRAACGFGAVGYMLAPYLLSLTYAGHDAKMFVAALFPLCVMTLELLIRRRQFMFAILFGGTLGLLFLTSHPQMVYFSAWGLLIYAVLNLRRILGAGGYKRTLPLLVLAAAIGIGIGSIQFLPTYYYTTNFSPRTGGVSYEFASSWSLHPEEIVSLLYPMFGGYQDSYWGRNPFKLNCESPGPMVLLLAVGGFILFLKRREALPWLVLFLFCPVYALGAHTPLFKAVFYAVPGAKFLRAPSLIMFMFSCASSVLAAMLVDAFLAGKGGAPGKRVATYLAIALVVLTLVATVGHGMLLDVWQGLYGSLDPGKLATATGSARSLAVDAAVLAAFGLGVLLLPAGDGKSWRRRVWLALAFGGILATSLPHSTRFIRAMKLSEFVRSDPMIEHVKKDPAISRTLPATSSAFYNRNYLPIFGLETANGFYDNRIKYYDQLSGPGFENLFIPNIMRITNVKYVIATQRIDHPILTVDRDFGRAFVYRNNAFLPRAFLVHEALVAESDSAALALLKDPEFDPARTVILHDGDALEYRAPRGDERVEIKEYRPDRIVINASVSSPGYLFYSGNYLPFWRARIDGREASVVRADVAMSAVYVEPGEHLIEMRYRSDWFEVGSYLCLGSCAFVAASLALTLRRGRRRHA